MPLFASSGTGVSSSSGLVQKEENLELITILEEVNVDALSPREALDILYKLKEQLKTPENA